MSKLVHSFFQGNERLPQYVVLRERTVAEVIRKLPDIARNERLVSTYRCCQINQILLLHSKCVLIMFYFRLHILTRIFRRNLDKTLSQNLQFLNVKGYSPKPIAVLASHVAGVK